MIFVTVGTHEQQFNRLLKWVSNLVSKGIIKEKVIVQTGYSTYIPENCDSSPFFPYSQMLEYVKEARIVITHGGPSSFIMPLQIGKTPIVVPRKEEFNEHVNNHQVTFCRTMSKRMGTILVVEEEEEFCKTILEFDLLVKNINREMRCNNAKFNSELQKIVDDLLK